ncbi:class I SAM-dependent methyltransferase [Streptomyces sp. NPDC047082]|uniref:class I SAM-dependent DNA methyltransferase n=1 Tax=Streptomyces sp. NPDC047082 TaxID=3155259 RepID=UPI0033F17FF9
MQDGPAAAPVTCADVTEPDFIQATRSSYDAIAKEYSDRYPDHLADRPVDRAVLTAFAELATTAAPAPVADLGSGPGHVTARLHDLGVQTFGVDISPRMTALAREAHPHLRFHVGSLTSLDLPDGTLGGIAALYSIIHVPDEHLPATFAEFHRTLVPGGHVLLAFQYGDGDGLRLTERFGHEISLDYHWRTPDTVADLLAEAGLHPIARTVREPLDEEKLPRGFVLARKAPADRLGRQGPPRA